MKDVHQAQFRPECGFERIFKQAQNADHTIIQRLWVTVTQY